MRAISATGGSCDQWPFPPDRMPPRTAIDGTCNGSDQCREAVRYQIKYGADLIKLCVSGGVLSADPVANPQFAKDEIGAMVLVPTRMARYWVEKQAQTYPPLIAAKARTAAAAHRDMFRTALRVGVPIALGTDQTVMPGGHGSNALEFSLMTELGMAHPPRCSRVRATGRNCSASTRRLARSK